MVEYVGVAQMRDWLSSTGVETAIADLTEVIEEDFLRWRQFDRVARVASHSPGGVVELMPTSDGEYYAFKYVNGHPGNPAQGLLTVTGFGVLSDVATGYPLLVSEMTILTALRTAATSAMAARALARPESSTLALIGTGSQAEFQALGMRAVLGVNTVQVWDTDPAAMAKFADHASALGFDVRVASSAADAVDGADIVTTCTADKTNATVLTDDMVVPGVHINAIGGDCPGKTELDAAILRRALVAVEYSPQTRIEGEIQQLEPDHPVTALWDVLASVTPGRTARDQVTVFDSVGFAMEDFSALRHLHRQLAGTGIAQQIDLIADPPNPKDLFSLAVPMSVAI